MRSHAPVNSRSDTLAEQLSRSSFSLLPRVTGLPTPAQVTLRVAMSCGGCSGAVERVIKKMEGVEDYSVDLETQKVVVKGDVDPQKVFEAISKTGKKTEMWQ